MTWVELLRVLLTIVLVGSALAALNDLGEAIARRIRGTDRT